MNEGSTIKRKYLEIDLKNRHVYFLWANKWAAQLMSTCVFKRPVLGDGCNVAKMAARKQVGVQSVC